MQNYTQYLIEPGEVTRIFGLIYGRDPGPGEMPLIDNLCHLNIRTTTDIFRAILSSFDHQTLKTGFTVRFSEKDISYIQVRGFELAIDKTDIAVSLPISQGNYESHLLSFYANRIKVGMTVVDVGANIGLYSLLASQLVGEEGHVLSFEPNSENCRLFLLSLNRNRSKNVTLFPVALSSKRGHEFFTTCIGSNGGLLPNNVAVLGDPSCIVVPTARLDDLIQEHVDFIKIDVEGAEALVVMGAKNLIERDRPIITSEFSMEMLPRVSGITCHDYLYYFLYNHYDIFIIDRISGNLERINDIDIFLKSYGSMTRIEDLAFIPVL